MEFRLLGPLEVWADRRRVNLGGGRQRTLLAVLLVHANEVVSTDRLIHDLWGERPPATAQKALQNFVSQLRRRLGDERIITRAPGYALNVDPDEIDARRFERLVAEGRGLLTDAPDEASEKLREALSLRRGPPLHEFAFEEFAQDEIARLEELALATLETRFEADLALGRHAELIPELETAVKRHPLRERVRGQLMLALYRSHRQADALAVYQEGRRVLADELGLEPGEELQRLQRAILNHDPSLLAGPRAPTGTVTFLFSDVEGSTRHVRRLGDKYGLLLEQHHRLLRDAFAEHNGHEVDNQGDAFFFAFRRARDAVAAAVAAQRRLLEAKWPDDAIVAVRVGIHTGEPALADAGYHGLDVVRAARISAAAHGGQILVSSATRDLVGDDGLPEVAFRDLGQHELKDFEGAHRLFQVAAPDLPETFPPPRTRPGAPPLDIGGREDELAAAAGAAVAEDRDAGRGFAGARRLAVAGAGLGLVGALAAAAAVLIVVARGTGEDERVSAGAASSRIALVLPRPPNSEREDVFVNPLVDALRVAERDYGVTGQIFVANELRPESRSFRGAIERVRSGGFDLVVTPGGILMQALGPVAEAQPSTRFVIFESPVDLPNATGYLFDGHDSAYLAGYLSGLMEAESGPRLNRARVLSVIGGVIDVPAVTELVEGFQTGVRHASPGVKVLVDYSEDFVDRSKCEAIANRHIDAGADIVFAAAGTCSFGALAAAELRGVWGIGVDGDRSYLGDHILVSTTKRYDRALLLAVRSFVQGRLRGGQTIALGLDDDAVGIAGINPSVPESIRRKVALTAAALRRGEEPEP